MKLRKSVVLLVTSSCCLWSCGGELDANELDVSNEQNQANLTSKDFAPTGSDLNFIGLYRLKILDGNECLKQDRLFGPCATGNAASNDQFAVYLGNDNKYSACLPTAPVIVGKEQCGSPEVIDDGPDYFMWDVTKSQWYDYSSYPSFLTEANLSESNFPIVVCNSVYLTGAYKTKCLDFDMTDPTDVPHQDDRKIVKWVDTYLSVQDETGAYRRGAGQIRADETAPGSGQYFLRKANPELKKSYPMLARNAKAPREVIWGTEKTDVTDLNRYWVPMAVPPPGGEPAYKKIVPTVTVPPSPPTCSITATPRAAKTSTVDIVWNSSVKGLTAFLVVDGAAKGPVPVDGSKSVFNLTAGIHKATLSVGGVAGTGKCIDYFLVPSPTIDLSMSPRSGSKTTAFEAKWTTTNATSCKRQLDSGTEYAVTCSSGTYTAPKNMSWGSHAVKLSATGNGKTITKSELFTVAPTCSATISPTTGTLSANTLFTITFASDAESCTWTHNATDKGPIACNKTLTYRANEIGVGSHRATLYGVGGPVTSWCSSEYISISN